MCMVLKIVMKMLTRESKQHVEVEVIMMVTIMKDIVDALEEHEQID
jgi:hypothetical protein